MRHAEFARCRGHARQAFAGRGLRGNSPQLGQQPGRMVGQDSAGRVLHHSFRRGHHHGAGLVHFRLHPRSGACGGRYESLHASGRHYAGQEQLAGQRSGPCHALRLVRNGKPDQRAAQTRRQTRTAGSEAVRWRPYSECRHGCGRPQHRVRPALAESGGLQGIGRGRGPDRAAARGVFPGQRQSARQASASAREPRDRAARAAVPAQDRQAGAQRNRIVLKIIMTNSTPPRKIRVLIVDDSALVRKLLTEILDSAPDIDVVGAAPDAYSAREKIKALNPDVLTLDVEMPRMDGITFLRNLMRLRPMPVVMVSSLTDAGAEVTLDALSIGAVDYLSKPKVDLAATLGDYGDELLEKIRCAARARIRPYEPRA